MFSFKKCHSTRSELYPLSMGKSPPLDVMSRVHCFVNVTTGDDFGRFCGSDTSECHNEGRRLVIGLAHIDLNRKINPLLRQCNGQMDLMLG